jgi:transposase-like protein
METTNIVDFARRDGMTDALTELLRTGAQQLIATAVEAEFSSYLAQFADLRTDAGHAAVVRNGHHPERPFQTSIGPVSVRIPKVRSKDGTPVTFRSALVPPYVRRTKTLEAALPWLYLKGISSGEMGAALKVLLGPDAAGLSANTVSRLKRDWAKEYDGWKDAAFDDEPIVYIWAPSRQHALHAPAGQWTASIAAFEAKMTSSAPLLLWALQPVAKSAFWPSRTGCASPHRAGVRFFSASKSEE